MPESISPSHIWNPTNRSLCANPALFDEGAESIFALANTTSLVLGTWGSNPYTHVISFIEVTNLRPTSVSQCKDGGWQTFNGIFKNQGDCTAYVDSGGANPPSGPNAPA